MYLVFGIADGKQRTVRPSHAWPSVTNLLQCLHNNIRQQYRYKWSTRRFSYSLMHYYLLKYNRFTWNRPCSGSGLIFLCFCGSGIVQNDFKDFARVRDLYIYIRYDRQCLISLRFSRDVYALYVWGINSITLYDVIILW